MILNDLKIEKNRQRRDQNIRHRNRLFMRASETASPSPPPPNPNSSQPKPSELGKIVANQGQGQNNQPKNEQNKTAKTEPGQESHCQNETKETFSFFLSIPHLRSLEFNIL